MASRRDVIIDWAEQGRIAPDALPHALAVAGVTPDGPAWRRFIAALLLSLGALLLAAGVIFFFAYNWQALGRFQKFALVQGLFAAAAFGAWFYGPAKMAGQAALLLATLLTGAIFALVGQTYQTGADPWQLFALWALLIVPWVAVSRMPVLWLMFAALVNLALALYFQTFHGIFGMVFSSEVLIWMLFALNGVALVVWEACAKRGAPWMQTRWPARTLAAAVGTAITSLAVVTMLDRLGFDLLRLVVYAAWLGAMYAYYRRTSVDLFMLAGGVLSAIVVVATALGRLMIHVGDEGGFLLVGLVVVGLSAAGALWLRRIAAERGE